MKIFLAAFASILLLLTSCSDENQNKSLTKTVAITNTIELTIPEDYDVEQLQGHDSSVGKIINSKDSSLLIFWDIGFLAGEYVDPDGPGVNTTNSANSTFNFERRESLYLQEEDCCGFFTFPNDGPANFICLDDANYELVFDIIKTLEVK